MASQPSKSNNSNMSQQNTHSSIAYIKRWLGFGWQAFKQTYMQSMAFSSIFMLIGLVTYFFLHQLNADLIIYPFIAGFFIVAPLLIIGFQRVGHKIAQAEGNKLDISLKDYFSARGNKNSGIWFAVFILSFCYFIWITDALVIYGLYFGIEPLPLTEKLFTDPNLRSALLSYLFYSALMGLVTAIIGFLLGVISIPAMLHNGVNFVDAIHLSIRIVLENKLLMALWASVLVMITTVTLVLALPLLIIILPVLGFASYAVYRDLVQSLEV